NSDGRLSPRDVVEAARERGLHAISLTDHDVLFDLPEAPPGMELVPGIEMTAQWRGPRAVHVLGYFIDPQDIALNNALDHARELMARHVDAVLAEVRKAGGTLERSDLDRYRHRYAGGAALVLGMLE